MSQNCACDANEAHHCTVRIYNEPDQDPNDVDYCECWCHDEPYDMEWSK